MLSLVKKRKLGSTSIPSNLTTLSISWFNNQFKAVAVHRGAVVGTWERPGDTDGPDRFDAFIREAGQATGYKGQSVSLVLAHPRLVQQLIDVPPVKGSALEKVIQRQAQQQKMFAGEAAFVSQISPSDKTSQRVVLHLFPKLLLNQFIQGCKRNGLHLTSVLPASAVLQHQLTQLPVEKEDIGLVAAETGGSTTMVAGTGEGKILLARTLAGNWNEEVERLAVDLNPQDRLTGDLLADEAQQDVVGVRVVEALARGKVWRVAAHDGQHVLGGERQQGIGHVGSDEGRVLGVAEDAGGHAEHLADGDAIAVGQAGHVLL